MRYLLPILVLLHTGLPLMGQDPDGNREGRVTFITSQSVYVRFSSMEGISEGDTLYKRQGDTNIPALQINNLSSIS